MAGCKEQELSGLCPAVHYRSIRDDQYSSVDNRAVWEDPNTLQAQ